MSERVEKQERRIKWRAVLLRKLQRKTTRSR